MKKFFAVTIIAVTLFLCENPAQAVAVRLCDNKVQNVVAAMKYMGDEIGISIWGTEYYTYQGARRCELHFGNTDNNTIRFRVNNDDTIARALVSMWVSNSSELRSAFDSSFQLGIIAGMVLFCSGVSESEMDSLVTKATDKFSIAVERNPYMRHYHEKTSLWCSSIQRYVVWDFEFSYTPELHFDVYLYAHD